MNCHSKATTLCTGVGCIIKEMCERLAPYDPTKNFFLMPPHNNSTTCSFFISKFDVEYASFMDRCCDE